MLRGTAFEKSHLEDTVPCEGKGTLSKTGKGLIPAIKSVGALILDLTGARIVGNKLLLFLSSLAHSILLQQPQRTVWRSEVHYNKGKARI